MIEDNEINLRMRKIETSVAKLEVSVESIKSDITHNYQDIKEILTEMKNNYVHREEFLPIKRIVYWTLAAGVTSLVSGAVFIIINYRG